MTDTPYEGSEPPPCIVIINGPLGIGKSTTAWALSEKFAKAVMLDGDYIAAFHPFDFYDQTHLDYAYDLFAVLMRHHVAHGFRHFVVNWVFESAAQLEALSLRLTSLDIPIYPYRLTADPDIVAQRVWDRGNDDVMWEVERARALHDILEAAAREGDLGHVIDTTSLNPQAVAARIWDDLVD